jgi:hypothetical protein
MRLEDIVEKLVGFAFRAGIEYKDVIDEIS